MRCVLGSRASIGGVLGSGRGGAALWYLAGGVSAANCVAAYQPKGAASLAASYTNLATPGTYTAAPGTAPTFAAATGWSFAQASSTYLTTGIVPASGWSAIVRLSDAIYNSSASAPVLGSGVVGSSNSFQLIPIETTNALSLFVYGNAFNNSTKVTAGVLALAGSSMYIDGSSAGSVGGTFSGSGVALVIGAHNNAGTIARHVTAKIQAIAIYNTTLTAPQVAAFSAAMAAL